MGKSKNNKKEDSSASGTKRVRRKIKEVNPKRGFAGTQDIPSLSDINSRKNDFDWLRTKILKCRQVKTDEDAALFATLIQYFRGHKRYKILATD